MVLGKVNNMNWTFYSPIYQMCFLSSVVYSNIVPYTCELSYCLSSLSVWASSRFITNNKSSVMHQTAFYSLWSLELTLESPLKLILSLALKITLDLLMVLPLLASSFGSVSPEALLIMHMRHLVKRSYSIPLSTCANISLTIRVIQTLVLACLVAQIVKHLPAMWETQVQSLGWEDPVEKEMAIHSSTLDWKIPWTEEPCRLQCMRSQRVGHDWVTALHFRHLLSVGQHLGSGIQNLWK